ncbi:hypothetical protein F5I97DRAFT_2034868 [Phlebopus sp. FC_14]|nr:hypothetical protein F5I97DRAFT_2034868 [Phlebopus sp. FC_14]
MTPLPTHLEYPCTTDASAKIDPPTSSARPKDTEANIPYSLGQFAIDEDRRIKVVVIGAGFGGIAAGVRLPQRLQNLDLTIYEKNAGVGGTWYSNRYPGLSCDIPSHTYQFTFEENVRPAAVPNGLLFMHRALKYAHIWSGSSTSTNCDSTSDYSTNSYMPGTMNRPENGTMKIRRPARGDTEKELFEEFEDVADFVLCCAGALSRWSWPKIEGLKSFTGKLMHSADWDTDDWREGVKDWKDKKVGVIGVGSSAMQIVPALQPYVGQLFNFVRGKTWVAGPICADKLAEMLKRDPFSKNYQFDEQDKAKFRDPKFYKGFRRELEAELNFAFGNALRHDEAGLRAHLLEGMKRRLEKKSWIADHITPEFPIACRRLTPGPGFLEALCEENVDFVPKDIKRVTQTGLETTDGQHYDLDILVCATGYDTDFKFPFPVIGRSGLTLRNRFDPHPVTYLSICTDGFPNWFQCLGPNSLVGAGSLLAVLEQVIEYAGSVLLKMQRERLKSIEVKREAVADFDEYLEAFFPGTVFSAKCRSWYKLGKEEGRVVALWPGSCLHAVRALERPRWEDYNYEYLDGRTNRFHWLGDGTTYNEKYMRPGISVLGKELDFHPVPSQSKLSE